MKAKGKIHKWSQGAASPTATTTTTTATTTDPTATPPATLPDVLADKQKGVTGHRISASRDQRRLIKTLDEKDHK